jgi:hypothetical protein
MAASSLHNHHHHHHHPSECNQTINQSALIPANHPCDGSVAVFRKFHSFDL